MATIGPKYDVVEIALFLYNQQYRDFTSYLKEQHKYIGPSVRDWSLITGREGAMNRRGGGGHVKFYPYEKGGQHFFNHAEGRGHKRFWGISYVVA